MIGSHEDCPVRIFAVMAVEGDGRFVDSVSVWRLFATREAAESFALGHNTCTFVRAFTLSTSGEYEPEEDQ